MDLNQITIPVRDMAQSIAFYQKLGLRLIVYTPGHHYARFELPVGATTFSLHEDAAAQASETVLYFEVADVDARYEKLQAEGIVFETAPKEESWRWREARFRDPTGHPLCLYRAGPDRRFPPWRREDSY